MNSNELRIIPLGGLGEVGKNMMVLEYGDDTLLIDAGIMFPENDMLGIDVVIPDFSYLMDKFDRVRAIVITHGHEDHIGALPYVLQHLQVPIYATRLTMGLIQAKVRARDLADVPLNVIQAGERFTVGPFGIEFFRVNHSIPDGVGLAIRTPVGLVVHSGDFKFDPTPVIDEPMDVDRLASLGDEGVLVLLSDSTNAESRGMTPSERSVQPAFDNVFSGAQGRIIVAAFASHLQRIQQVLWVAERHGRKVAVAGRSMEDNIKIARGLEYLEVPDRLLIKMGQVASLPPEKVVILATGTQGEPTAALGRISRGSHRQLRVEKSDTVIISAHPIPGNDEEVNAVINRLFQRGAEVVYDKIAQIHVSGHAGQEEQRQLLELVRPRYFIPIHGELRHLHRHGHTAAEAGVPSDNIFIVENGYTLTFTEDGGTIGERVPGTYVFVDGSGVGDVGPAVIRDREILSRDGFVVVSVKLDGWTGELLDLPEIISRGFVYMREAGELLDEISSTVVDLLDRQVSYQGQLILIDLLKGALKTLIYDRTRRRPMIIPVITEI